MNITPIPAGWLKPGRKFVLWADRENPSPPQFEVLDHEGWSKYALEGDPTRVSDHVSPVTAVIPVEA